MWDIPKNVGFKNNEGSFIGHFNLTRCCTSMEIDIGHCVITSWLMRGWITEWSSLEKNGIYLLGVLNSICHKGAGFNRQDGCTSVCYHLDSLFIVEWIT